MFNKKAELEEKGEKLSLRDGTALPNTRNSSFDPLLSDVETAEIFGCGRSTIWRWAADGTIPKPIKIGGMSRWRKSTIDALIENAEAEALAA